MKLVWKKSKAKGGTLLVLLAIADYANEKHDDVAWPSVRTLAAKARMTERNVQLALKRLEKSGELAIEPGKGPYRTNLYRVKIVQGEEFSGLKTPTGEGEKFDMEGVKPTSPNPLSESLKEPLSPLLSPHGDVGSVWELFVSEWNQIPGVRPFKGPPGPGLMKLFTRRMKEHPSPSFWKEVCASVKKSGFLTGSGKSGWHVTLPWILKQANLEKVAGGTYSAPPNTKFVC